MGFDSLQGEKLQQRLIVFNSHILLKVKEHLLRKLTLILKLNFDLRWKAFENSSEIKLGRPNGETVRGNSKGDVELDRKQLLFNCHLEGNAIIILLLHKFAQVNDYVFISSELHPNV